MRYLTHYTEYPIYEPAEGGYYYPGRCVEDTEKLSKRQCKIRMKQIWKELDEENFEMFGHHLADLPRNRYGDFCDQYGRSVYPWILVETPGFPAYIVKDSEYVGEGESYVIEKRLGASCSGRVPYC